MGLTGEMQALRVENDERHRENREDVRTLGEKMHAIELELEDIKGKIKPLIDNGQPGIVSRMSAKLDEVVERLADVRVAQGAEAGRRGEGEWIRSALTALITGLVVVLAAHFWK